MPLGDKQLLSLRHSTTRVTVWEGSIRAGKTFVSLFRWMLFLADAPLGGQLVMIARTRDTAARNLFSLLQDRSLFGDIADQVKYTPGAPTATIMGRTVFVIGASDAKSEKVLRGLTVAGAYVDEATVIPEEFFTQLLGRMSVPGAQLFCTTNPDSPGHWLKVKYLDRIPEPGTAASPTRPLDNWTRFHFVMTDNPSLTQEFIDSTSREYTGLWFRRFIMGEWVAGEGAIYTSWDESKHVVAWDKLPRMQALYMVGMDYGTTNASSAILLGLAHQYDDLGYRTGSKLYLVDEWRYAPKDNQGIRLTDADLSRMFREWLVGAHLPYPTAMEPTYIAVDPAASSFKVQLAMDGIGNVINADNQVSYGIGVVNSLLGTGDLLVSDRCTGFIEEVSGYSWDAKAQAAGEDRPIKVADHSLDAARYAIVSSERQWRPILADKPRLQSIW